MSLESTKTSYLLSEKASVTDSAKRLFDDVLGVVDKIEDKIDSLFNGGSSSNRTARNESFGTMAVRDFNAAQATLSTGDGMYRMSPNHISGRVWPIGQMLDAELGLPQSRTVVSAETSSFNALSRFGDAVNGYSPNMQDTKPNNRYYDDNAWLGIDLVKEYQRTKNPNVLLQAKQLFNFEMQGWNSLDGGEFWKQRSSYRPAVATAAVEQFALDLCAALPNTQATAASRQAYLGFAVMANNWMNSRLMNSAGLYQDHVGQDGSALAQYTYNQGLMIGNETKLYQLTGEQWYLQQAERTANSAINRFPSIGNSGMDVSMAGTFAENLSLLNGVSPSSRIRAALFSYAAQANFQLGADGLIANGGTKTAVDQAGAIQIEEAAAQVSGS